MTAHLLSLVLVLSAAPLPLAAFAQAPAPAAASANAPAPAMQVDITLEQKKNGRVEAMAPGHVFEPGDVIRLRLESRYEGFLYVMDQGSSGKFTTVFPSAETGSDNRVHVGGRYLVPAVEEGWFEVMGPAGFDVLYFLLSPAALANPSVTTFVAPGPAGSLKPRCNDKIFRARGECMDDSAGPAAISDGAELPAPLIPLAGSASRDIVFSKGKGASVSVAGATAAPTIYTFRLAHK